MNGAVFVAALIYAIASAASTLKSGEVINTQTATALDTSVLTAGDTLTLNVVEPYPSGVAGLAGAKITLSITGVTHVPPRNRARVAFLFDRITFGNGQSESIAAFVLSSKVVRRGEQTSLNTELNSNTTGAAAPLPFSTQPNTIFWQRSIGKSTATTPSATGGYAYTVSGDAKLPAGTPVTIQLARDLTIPD